LAPFVDDAICITGAPTEVTQQIAKEYGARMVMTSQADGPLFLASASIGSDWLLYLRSSERADERGMERLKPFLRALPADVAGAGVEVILNGHDLRDRSRQIELRLFRRDHDPSAIAAPNPYIVVTDEHRSRFPTAPLEVAASLPD
jgi:hypothetical protein